MTCVCIYKDALGAPHVWQRKAWEDDHGQLCAVYIVDGSARWNMHGEVVLKRTTNNYGKCIVTVRGSRWKTKQMD